MVKGFGFHQNEQEACVYKKVSRSVVVFLILCVDDILLIENDIPMLESIKTSLKGVFYEELRGSSIYFRYKYL
jgi:hypothetical protein